jgi:drug/metabolite transporter (DMT)-like permease
MPFEYLFPLLSAAVYVVGVLLLKRATELGVNVWRMTCVCNLVAAACFAPLALLGAGTAMTAGPWWQPALVAGLFVTGQMLSLLALRIGDVSVATPVLGLKIVLVAMFTTLLLAEQLPAPLWAAAALSSVAIALLNRTRSAAHPHVGTTIVASALAASAFAMFDVLVQKWSPAWGSARFLPVMMGCSAAYSLALWPLGTESESGVPNAGKNGMKSGWLWVGALCLGVQSVGFVWAISFHGHATAANVLYSSRGLWSVVAVWLVGHWFRNQERHLGAKILAWRLCGAALMLAAILLVLIRR